MPPRAGKQALLGRRDRSSACRCEPVRASGVVSGGGKTVTYGALIGDKLFNQADRCRRQQARYDPACNRRLGVDLERAHAGRSCTLVGTQVPRIDIPDKVTGTYTYVHNIRVPGMLHGRVVRPRGQGSVYRPGTAAVFSVDADSIVPHPRACKVFHKGDFLGVVAPHEYDAIQAAAQLKVVWVDDSILPGDGNIWQEPAQDAGQQIVVRTPRTSATSTRHSRRRRRRSRRLTAIRRHIHGAIGPTCLVADVTPNRARVLYTNGSTTVSRARAWP